MEHNFPSWKADGQVEIDLAVQSNWSIYRGKSQQANQFVSKHRIKIEELHTSLNSKDREGYGNKKRIWSQPLFSQLAWKSHLIIPASLTHFNAHKTVEHHWHKSSLSLNKIDDFFPGFKILSSVHRSKKKHQ